MTRAEIHDNLLVALDTLRSHKVRSTLTVLGIVIGVTSVISVAAIIEGLNLYIQEKVQSFGSRTYFVTRFPAGTPPDRLPERFRARRYLEYSYADYLRQSCPSIASATAFGTRAFAPGQSNQITYGNERVERVFLRGAEPEYPDAIPLFSVNHGRFISRYDEEHAHPVVVLGAAIADSLFPHTEPLGKSVRLNGKLYEVVGIFEQNEGIFGAPSVDSFAVIPLSEFKKRYPEAKDFIIIAFSLPIDADIERSKDEVRAALRRLRHVKNNQPDDFEILSPDFLATLWNQLTGALVILTSIISSIGLLVGGIGVMNIMLISVVERTNEIGIRKAIGARRSDIRVQFLLEAVLVTCVGGIIGIIFGTGISFLIHHFASIPATVSLVWVVLGVAISVGVGLFFGFFPANRAANLDPIVCLRYE